MTQDTSANPTSPKPLRAWVKCLIVFIAAIIASMIVYVIEGKSPSNLARYSPEILGGAFVYFAIAMILSSFIRGSSGAAIGVTIVSMAAFYDGYQAYHKRKPERDAMNALNQHQQNITEAARSSLDRTGHMDVDPATIRGALDDLSTRSSSFDPKTASATEAVVAITAEMVKPAEEMRKISTEMASETFQTPSSSWTREDIDYRLAAFRRSAVEFMDVLPNLDIRLKSELARRNIPPLAAKNVTEKYIRSARMDITIPLAQSNIDWADILIQKFQLLRAQHGRWRVRDSTLYFDDSAALSEWNDTCRRLFTIAERRESLERSLLVSRQQAN